MIQEDLFETLVFQILREQPPRVFDSDFTLTDVALKQIIAKSTSIYNDIMSRDVTMVEKGAAIVSTMASLACERALLEKIAEAMMTQHPTQRR